MSFDFKPHVAGRAKVTWSASNLREPAPFRPQQCLVVEKNDNLFVTRQQSFERGPNKQPWVWLFAEKFPEENKKGWIPAEHVEAGARKKDIVINAERVIPLPPRPSHYNEPANVYHKTLRRLWDTIVANKDQILAAIPNMPDSAKEVLFGPQAKDYADHLFRCTFPDAATIMASGNFDPASFRSLRAISANWPGIPCVYARLYWDFGTQNCGNTTFDDAIYGGQAQNAANRDTQHGIATVPGSKSNHYRLAYRSQQKKMVAIMREDERCPASFLDIAEFTFVCLFNSWWPALFTPGHANMLGSFVMDFQAACEFSALARKAFVDAGWRPKQMLGLNWNTPILRNWLHPRTWISWYDEQKQMKFFKCRRVINFDPTANYWSFVLSRTEFPIPEVIAKTSLSQGQTRDTFARNQYIQVIVEVKLDKNRRPLPHPFRFLRYPRIGPNTAFESMFCMALRIEWVSPIDGQWKTSYLERSKLWILKQNPQRLAYHETALMLLCDVQGLRYTDAPSWTRCKSFAVVQEIQYDHLKQQANTVTTVGRAEKWPQDNSMEYNRQRLLQLFPPGPGQRTTIGSRPPQVHYASGKKTATPAANRKNCDMCHSQYSTSPCDHNPVTGTCRTCAFLNRPCTWTQNLRSEELGFGQPLEELGISVSLGRFKKDHVIRTIPAPFNPDLEREDFSKPDD